jgi:hypothetical protein
VYFLTWIGYFWSERRTAKVSAGDGKHTIIALFPYISRLCLYDSTSEFQISTFFAQDFSLYDILHTQRLQTLDSLNVKGGMPRNKAISGGL